MHVCCMSVCLYVCVRMIVYVYICISMYESEIMTVNCIGSQGKYRAIYNRAETNTIFSARIV